MSAWTDIPTSPGAYFCHDGHWLYVGFVSNETDDRSLQFNGINHQFTFGTWPVTLKGCRWFGPIQDPQSNAGRVDR